jgi:hypothetical protein
MLDWKITSHLAAILPLSTQSFRVVSADGRMVDYDLKKETWSKMTTLPVNNILAVIKRENDWEFLIGPANNEKILRSSSTTDFKTFPEPKGTNLEMTGCETFRTAVGADLLWACATFKKAENSWQLKVASRPLESGEWSAWRTVWEGEQEPLHFDCAASTEKDFACLAVSLSLRDKDKKLVKIFRIDHDLKASDLPATPAPPPVDGQSEPSPTTPGNAAPIASDTGGSSNTSTGTGTQKPPKDGAEAAVAEATPFPWAIVIVVAIAALALGAIFTFILTRAKKTAK